MHWVYDVVFPRCSEAVDLFTDSMGVVSLSRNAVLSAAVKHIEIADFYVRELVARGIVTVAHVPTSDMVADVFTKPLARIKFSYFISIILGLAQFGTMGNGCVQGSPGKYSRPIRLERRVRPIQVVPPGENDASGPSTKFDEEWAPATAAQTIDGEVNLQIASERDLSTCHG